MADKPVSIWQCEKCQSTYKSYIRLVEPPFHRCPDHRSIHVRSYTLIEGEPATKPEKKAKN